MPEDKDFDFVAIGMAVLGLLLKEAPELIDAFKGGDRDRVAAWLRQRDNSIRERVRFEALRDDGE